MSAAPEFSRPIDVRRLPPQGSEEHLSASAAERAEVAKRLDLIALDRLEADLTLRIVAGGTLLEIGGNIDAEVVQRCVVTLEPVPASLKLPVEIVYALSPAALPEGEEASDPDAPEPLPADGVDLGEEVVQTLSLGLDPYPRAAGAALPEGTRDPEEHPFAKLRGLTKRED